MKRVLIFASPHPEGFTSVLADEYLRSLPSAAETEWFDAYKINPAPCMGCGLCASSDSCISDDLDRLFDSVVDCDELIIASPVYFLSFPAPLKGIVDRLQRFHEANRRGDSRMNARSRRCTVLLTAGAPSEKGEVIGRQLRWIAECLGISETKLIVCADTDKTSPEEFRVRAKAAVR